MTDMNKDEYHRGHKCPDRGHKCPEMFCVVCRYGYLNERDWLENPIDLIEEMNRNHNAISDFRVMGLKNKFGEGSF